MRNFQSLIVWQRSHLLTLKVYRLTKQFPKEELYGLTSQIRRSAASVPTNIAEGSGRNSNAEMRKFLIISSGSLSELEYQLILSKELTYLPENTFKELNTEITEIRKMIFAFVQSLPTIPN
jgi:four helix bundle protein